MKILARKYFLAFIFFILPLVLITHSAAASKRSRFQTADTLYKKRESPGPAKKALEIYKRLYLESPRSAEAAWKYSMASYYVAHHFIKKEKTAEKLYEQGKDAGRMGFLFNEDCAPCYFWSTINLLLWGKIGGKLRLIFVVRDAQKNLKKVNEINESCAFGGGWRTLGQIEAGLPGILGGNDERAKKYFSKAIKVAPSDPINYLYLARLLFENLNQKKEALKMAKQGLSLPQPEKDDIENISAIQDLREMVRKYQPPLKIKDSTQTSSSK